MRCRACNCSLTDFESSRRYSDCPPNRAAFVELCADCLGSMVDEIHTTEDFRLFDRATDVLPAQSADYDAGSMGLGHGPDADEPDEDFGRFDEDQV